MNSKGKQIADFDLLIGCTALENDLIMATDNVRHFELIPNIIIENGDTAAHVNHQSITTQTTQKQNNQ